MEISNYNRSRFSWFLFFMQKLAAKSRVVLYKSCRSAHKEPIKIEFVFVWFCFDFLRILQELAKKH
jgi:hypothetical protein